MILHSKLLDTIPGIRYGFGTRENPTPLATQLVWKQVHGVSIAEAKFVAQDCGQVDALWSRTEGVTVAVATADCVPILMARKDGNAVAAIHAGWRGTLERILQSVWNEISACGENASDWVGVIGPASGACCYEVGEELVERFLAGFPEIAGSLVTPANRRLDLRRINSLELSRLGVSAVEEINYCTRCSTEPKFWSYRRDGGGNRQYSGCLINRQGPARAL